MKAILFDFFDVIRTDAYKAWLKKHNYVLAGEFLEAVQAVDLGKIDFPMFLKRLSAVTGESREAIFKDMQAGAVIDQNILKLIEHLRVTYKIGLISNSPSSFLRDLLQEHGLEKYFDAIIISEEAGYIKPDPAIYHLALDMLQISPEEAIFIDDNEKNIHGAEAIGIRGIIYTDFTSLAKELQRLGVIDSQL